MRVRTEEVCRGVGGRSWPRVCSVEQIPEQIHLGRDLFGHRRLPGEQLSARINSNDHAMTVHGEPLDIHAALEESGCDFGNSALVTVRYPKDTAPAGCWLLPEVSDRTTILHTTRFRDKVSAVVSGHGYDVERRAVSREIGGLGLPFGSSADSFNFQEPLTRAV